MRRKVLRVSDADDTQRQARHEQSRIKKPSQTELIAMAPLKLPGNPVITGTKRRRRISMRMNSAEEALVSLAGYVLTEDDVEKLDQAGERAARRIFSATYRSKEQ